MRHTQMLQLTLARILPLYLATFKHGSGREETLHNHCIHTLCGTNCGTLMRQLFFQIQKAYFFFWYTFTRESS